MLGQWFTIQKARGHAMPNFNRLRVSLIILVCGVASVAQAQTDDWPQYGWSENAEYCVRVARGDFEERKASGIVLKYDHDAQTLRRIGELQFQNPYRPLQTLVTNDGRFVVNLGSSTEWDDYSAALAIYDLQTGAEKVFSLEDIFPTEELMRRHTRWRMIYTDWFRQTEVEVDQAASLVYLTGLVNGATDAPEPPTIVVDLAEMTVGIQPAPFWKRKFEQAAQDRRQLEDAFDAYLWNAEGAIHSFMHDAIRETQQQPIIDYKMIDHDHLFRLEPGNIEPGDGVKHARFITLRFDKDAQEFAFVRETELKNAIAPSSLRLSRDANFLVTFDDQGTIGKTANTIVIYNLPEGRSKAFALEDFCTAAEMAQLLSSENIRLWRSGLYDWSWITFSGADFDRGRSTPMPGVFPHVLIDVAKMEVKLAEPFVARRAGDSGQQE